MSNFFIFVVYLELCCKKDPFLLFGVTLSCVFWMFMNIVDVYSVYYNTSIVPLLVSSVQSVLYILLVASLARWVQLVRRQNGGRFQMNLLNVEEYTLFQYTAPTLLYPLAIVTWNIIFGNQSWQKKSATTLIYYISVNCVVAAVIIGKGKFSNYFKCLYSHSMNSVVPGRTARMIAELNRSLLQLKQIFVRYVSHEIRSDDATDTVPYSRCRSSSLNVDAWSQVPLEHRPCGAGHRAVGDRSQQRRPCGVHQPGDRQDDPQHVLGQRNRDPDLERSAAL